MKSKPKGDTTQKQRIAKRRATLNKVAKSMGYPNWSAYETALIRKFEGR